MPLSGLLSGRYPLELLLHPNSAGVLDHYQHSDCTAQLLESVCRCQFLLVYVRHDTEFLWAESYFRTVSPSLSWTVSNQPLSHVYHSFGPCAIAAAILYFWNRDHLFNSVLYALPVGALLAEAVAIVLYLIAHQKFLFQLLMDIGGFLVFGGLFWRKVKSKPLYLLSVLLFAVIFYITACQ